MLINNNKIINMFIPFIESDNGLFKLYLTPNDFLEFSDKKEAQEYLLNYNF